MKFSIDNQDPRTLVSKNLLMLIVASLTYKYPKGVYELFISKYFFSGSNFSAVIPFVFNPTLDTSYTFSLKLNMAHLRHFLFRSRYCRTNTVVNKAKITVVIRFDL